MRMARLHGLRELGVISSSDENLKRFRIEENLDFSRSSQLLSRLGYPRR
jgi:hypothetical protein